EACLLYAIGIKKKSATGNSTLMVLSVAFTPNDLPLDMVCMVLRLYRLKTKIIGGKISSNYKFCNIEF
ncbi:MAG: hypothetical protein MI892_31755, partial [Desulfobacterales bacterium]|nr:hypothetical protein [Desulfobacterales bacterium]